MSNKKSASRKERFSQFLEYLKIDKGFSLSKVAENIGISVQGLYKIKRGESNPSRQTVMLLHIKYGLNTKWHESGKGEMVIKQGSDLIERSDEILMELLRMKNHVIEEMSYQNESLKKRNEQLKKKLQQKNEAQTPKLTRAKYNQYKQLLKGRLTGFDLGKMLTVLGIDKEQLLDERVIKGADPEKTVANLIAGGEKPLPKRMDDRIRRFISQELENKLLRDQKAS